jgi:hypothetical protein
MYKYYCTIFKKKKNKPIITFWVNTESEELVKAICILKDYVGEENKKIFEKLLEEEKKEDPEYKRILAEFDEKFRVLVSCK